MAVRGELSRCYNDWLSMLLVFVKHTSQEALLSTNMFRLTLVFVQAELQVRQQTCQQRDLRNMTANLGLLLLEVVLRSN